MANGFIPDNVLDVYRGEHHPSGIFHTNNRRIPARVGAGARRLGLSEEMYALHREQGQLWCNYHKAWEPAEQFGSYKRQGQLAPNPSCRAGASTKAAQIQRAKRARERAASKEEA